MDMQAWIGKLVKGDKGDKGDKGVSAIHRAYNLTMWSVWRF